MSTPSITEVLDKLEWNKKFLEPLEYYQYLESVTPTLAAAARRAQDLETAHAEWEPFREWAQEILPPKYLGQHYGDAVMKLFKEQSAQLEAAKGLLEKIIPHAAEMEEEITEKIHMIDFAGESEILCDARAFLKKPNP